MQRTNEIKAIMRQLKEANAKNESVNRAVMEACTVNEDEVTSTENDASETDLVLAKLEDILARFEKVLALSEGDEEKDEEEPAEGEEDEEPAEGEEDEEPAADEEDEEPAEESYTRQLETRLANLEKRFTESRRRQLRGSFRR